MVHKHFIDLLNLSLYLLTDENELDIVKEGGLIPIIDSAIFVANTFSGGKSRLESKSGPVHIAGSMDQFEELAAQCARALRNLSVNRKYESSDVCAICIY